MCMTTTSTCTTYVLQVVVNKPSGLQVLPGGCFHQRTALTLLQQHHQDNRATRWPACQPPAPVHRLGRGTSGEGQPCCAVVGTLVAGLGGRLLSSCHCLSCTSPHRNLPRGKAASFPAAGQSHFCCSMDAFLHGLTLLTVCGVPCAGVLVCACSPAARTALSAAFAAATAGTAGVTGHAGVSAREPCPCHLQPELNPPHDAKGRLQGLPHPP
jgi:hypothetical protein